MCTLESIDAKREVAIGEPGMNPYDWRYGFIPGSPSAKSRLASMDSRVHMFLDIRPWIFHSIMKNFICTIIPLILGFWPGIGNVCWRRCLLW